MIVKITSLDIVKMQDVNIVLGLQNSSLWAHFFSNILIIIFISLNLEIHK